MRDQLSATYLSGNGIEIGALCHPLSVNGTAVYVDRLDNDGLHQQYPDIPTDKMVKVDVVDDGETLEKFDNNSLDFVIANHFLEHAKDPLGTIMEWLSVLRPGGKIFCAIPDKEKCFDKHRPTTEIAHMYSDFEKTGDDWPHYLEFARGDEIEAKRLMDADYSIHRHTWDKDSILVFLINLSKNFDVKLRAFVATDERDEFIFVLEKL